MHLVAERPDVVLTGGAGAQFDYPALNSVLAHLQHGATLLLQESMPDRAKRIATISATSVDLKIHYQAVRGEEGGQWQAGLCGRP